MARTLTEIYTIAKECRNQYLELTEFKNSSKMSVLDAFTWVSSACIWAFENIMDVFKVDLAKDLQNRINGTPAYYANALMKYQLGDELVISEDGTKFSYPTVDETKRIVTKVSYSEFQEDGFYDKSLLLKIATGQPGNYKRIENEELLLVRAYLNQILFAGTHATVVSRNGDVLIPRVTAYYDGAVSEEEVYGNIEKSLNDFIVNLDFNGVVYVQKIIDAIQQADHVLDVYVSNQSSDFQGIFVAQYDDDNHLIVTERDDYENPVSHEQRIDRLFVPNSGFIKQSTKSGEEAGLQTWKESIVLKLEGDALQD
jgi:hypothetical protein